MPIIYASDEDGYVSSANANWATARDATTGSSFSSSTTRATDTVKAAAVPTRGGGTSYAIIRTFMYFDFRAVVDIPESATLNIYGYSQNSADYFVVKADSSIGTLGTADFDAIDGWNNSGVDNESNVTKYSISEHTTWSTSGYNIIPLNSTALKVMKGNTLYMALIESVHDLRNVQPSGNFRNGMHFTDYSGTSRDPYIDYKIGTPSTFFGANF